MLTTVAVAVIVDPLSPKDTLLEFEKTTAERLLDAVPAETLTLVRLVAIDAVIVDALRPKDTPLEFENVNAEARLEAVPADRLNDP